MRTNNIHKHFSKKSFKWSFSHGFGTDDGLCKNFTS